MKENGRGEFLATNADLAQNAQGCCFTSHLCKSSKVAILFQLVRSCLSQRTELKNSERRQSRKTLYSPKYKNGDWVSIVPYEKLPVSSGKPSLLGSNGSPEIIYSGEKGSTAENFLAIQVENTHKTLP